MTAFALLLAVAAADPPAFKAGVAVKVITPPGPMWMAGYASRNKPAAGKSHDLFAKAVALEDAAGTRLVLVTTDLIGLPKALADAVAADIEKFGIPRANLMLTSSHTHCGPVVADNLADMYDMPPDQQQKVKAYTAGLRTALAAVVRDALADMKPAAISYGSGTAGFAINRRQNTPKGVVIGTNPGGPVDHAVPVLKISPAGGGKPLAVVFGYACHNTTLSFYDWCGDYAGFAQATFEAAHPGTVAMFWTGCGADANPHPRGTQALAERHGRELAAAVAKVAAGDTTPVKGRFGAAFARVPLAFAKFPTAADLRADLLSGSFAHRTRATRLLAVLDAGKPIPPTYPDYPVQAWHLGDGPAWVALGGEVVADYAVRIRKAAPPGRPTWVAAYANDVMAYVPSKRVLAEGGYEADASIVYYGLPGRWADAVEDAIHAAVAETLTAAAPR